MIELEFKVPKIVGELKIKKMMAENYAVVNGIKNAPNKIVIVSRDYEHALEIIEKIKQAKSGNRIKL